MMVFNLGIYAGSSVSFKRWHRRWFASSALLLEHKDTPSSYQFNPAYARGFAGKGRFLLGCRSWEQGEGKTVAALHFFSWCTQVYTSVMHEEGSYNQFFRKRKKKLFHVLINRTCISNAQVLKSKNSGGWLAQMTGKFINAPTTALTRPSCIFSTCKWHHPCSTEGSAGKANDLARYKSQGKNS